MQITFDKNQPIGEIVADFPTAGLIFKKYRIDFCCGGEKPLKEAIADKQLDEELILDELKSAFADELERKDRAVDWNNADFSTLVNHVVNTHHAYLKRELGGLTEFTARIRNVHGMGHPELVKLDHLFRTFKLEIEEHLQKEEEQIFPLIMQYDEERSKEILIKAVSAIDELESEHSVAGDLLREMRETTLDYTLPPEACRSYTVTFQKLEELEDDMFQHIHLENNIMFPRLEKELEAL
jgi:regulator of cell morphogenesis and NO signaling